ncbi:MAG TPA: alpha/beta fold hydrolase [Rhizomicrobium sp.]|nr:alpha/beta fold hydrolase [Rhizomicrobium sp.]
MPRSVLRRRVYDAAIALFRTKGFEATTVEEIARAAGVAKGTLFNFFPTKSAILLHYYEALDAKFGAAMAAMSPADPKAELARFWGEAETLLRAEGPLADAIFRAALDTPHFDNGDIANADIDSGDKDRDALTAYFRACREAKTVNAGVEPAVAAHIVSDLWSATVMDWLRTGRRYGLKLRLATKLEALFKGLAPLILLALLFMPHAQAKEAMELEGLYEDATGVVAVVPFGEFGDGRFYIDYTSGRIGLLVARGDRMAVGEGLAGPKSDVGEIRRRTTGLRADVDGAARSLRAVPLARDELRVDTGGVTLWGEIVRRLDLAPKGTIVIVHGSNDAPRSSYAPWTMFLAARGFSVAVFDKRGSGGSSGDWTAGSFVELASDVRAVASAAHAKLPQKPLGMLGVSQAGWVMPLAAKEGGFDFIVSLMGPAVTPAEQTMETVEGQLQGYGFDKAETEKALAYYRLDLDVTMGKRPWDDIDAAYRKAAAAKAEWILAAPEAANAPTRAFLGRIARFDAAPYWARAKMPVLAIFGGKDSLVPVAPNAALLKTQLKGNASAKIVVLADANHVGMIARTGTFAEYPTLDRFDPAYFQTMRDWLDGRAGH